jgi:hypothetical protein
MAPNGPTPPDTVVTDGDPRSRDTLPVPACGGAGPVLIGRILRRRGEGAVVNCRFCAY